MMIRLTETIEVPRALEETLSFAADFGNIEQWDPGVSESVRLTGGPVAVGSRYRSRYRLVVVFGPSTTPMEYRVTLFEPPHRVILEGEGGSIRAVDEIRFEKIPEG